MGTNDINKQVWREILIECCRIFETQRKALQNYIKESEHTQKNLVLFLLARRIIINIRAIVELAGVSYKSGGSLLFKFPVGLLLRSCLIDSITGLYMKSQNDIALGHIMKKLDHDYAKALFEELEVYRDKLCSLDFANELIEILYTSSLEDTFLQYFDINDKRKESGDLKERSIWKVSDQNKYLPNGVSVNTDLKNMKKALTNELQFGSCAESLYAYYKYFSQWEHFSENGAGDVLADFGEDNINMPKAFGHIETALSFMLLNKVDMT